jgi:hypothetical protein
VYLYEQIPTTVSRQTEYAGLRLGMSKDEVGYPPTCMRKKVRHHRHWPFGLFG